MIRIKAKMQWNTDPKVKVTKALEKAQVVLDEQVLKDSNYFIPKDTGQLEDSSIIASRIGEGELIWDTKYARKVYYGVDINFHTDMNPNAQALWFEAAKSRFLSDWVRAAGQEVKDNI
ncbi:putative minor capsid protein 2 [Bacillus phage PBC1]|uniref:Putative minor capsid protein 2 n=1 Tax=Bacillus phage PBC1 TaxID=1161901 RepID=I1TLE6_9CAUD|nr:minor head protein [Bacillus phage PBC1]AFE86248.1 putative minor capsid protein 2 [Bacillus phage PBC1]